jgi:serine/threonine protein kinase
MVEPHGWTELADGDEFAGYRIERRLGRGGMGILYLGIEPGLERRVALKLIAPEAAADEVFARRFAEESRIAASIEHPNVVPIYAAGEEDGVPFIAMRFVSGSDLGVRLTRDGKLNPAEAVALIAQIGNGLDAIHAAGLVHRDVKPANVLLSGGEGAEHAYITDFGVARNVATQSGLTQTGRFVGTLDYVAPEQISGGTVDARVDVYALGCLLFKLLTGQVPFPRDGEAARLYAHLNDPPPAPSLYVPEVSMALDDVVIRAMSKPAEDRFPSAGDLGRAAQAALSGGLVAIPERTVATGAAATREVSTLRQSPERPSADALPEETETKPSQSAPTDATRRLPPAAGENAHNPGRRRLFLAAGLFAVAIAVVAVIVLSGGGSSNSPGAATGKSNAPETSSGGDAKKKQAPPPLTKAKLVAGADAVCLRSQEDFKAARAEFPNGETTPEVAYATELAGISKRAVKGFEALDAPASLQPQYGDYVNAQVRVRKYDQQALSAAKEGDEAAYLEAREARNDEQHLRYELARAVGLKKCSLEP